mgnify:CR=1 FL=1
MYLEISNPMDYHAALYIRLSKEDEGYAALLVGDGDNSTHFAIILLCGPPVRGL